MKQRQRRDFVGEHIVAEMRRKQALEQSINRSQPLLLAALKRVMAEIPSSRDWLDPVTEQMAREAIKSAEVESL